MRIFALLFLVIGAVLAGGAIYLGNEYIGQLQANSARSEPKATTVTVMVANRRLVYGDRIAPNSLSRNLRWAQWPADEVPEGAFRNFKELLGPEQDQARVVLRTVEEGEILLTTKLSGFGGSSRVAARVSDGMRAFTIPINAVSGVAGLVRPGDRVDILLTRTISRELTSSVILQNILVIATDQIANVESDRARVASTATVEVSPVEAQKLAVAQQVGRLSFTLRGADPMPTAQSGPDEMIPVNIRDLPDQPEILPEPEAEPEAPPATTVRVRRGTEVQTHTVD